MKIQQNKFKQALLEGKKQYGIWCGIPDSYVAEICAGSGFDWLLIDWEHAPFDLQSIISHMQAINQYDVSSIVRLPSADPNIAKQLLDAGAQSLLVPMIESAEQAELMAKSMRYPSRGTRGIGSGLARAAQWNRVNNYFFDADDQMCFLAQVETVKGVKALDEIMEVPDVDIIFLGPSDLAASMGYLGKAGHKDVQTVIIECIKKITAKGKIAGFLTSAPELIQNYSEVGALMIGTGIDTTILAKQLRSHAELYKPELGDQKKSNTNY